MNNDAFRRDLCKQMLANKVPYKKISKALKMSSKTIGQAMGRHPIIVKHRWATFKQLERNEWNRAHRCLPSIEELDPTVLSEMTANLDEWLSEF